MKALSIDNGVNINPLWTDRIAIALYPSAVKVTTPVATAAPATVSSSLPAGHYFYAISAIGALAEGILSDEVDATTDSTNDAVGLTFDQQAGISEYRIYRGVASGEYTEVFVCKTDAGTFEDDGSHIALEKYDSWSASKQYYVGDVVILSNIVYKCVLTNLNESPAGAMGYWVVVKSFVKSEAPAEIYDVIRKKDIVAVHPIFLPEIVIDGEVKPLISKITLEKQNGKMYYIDLTKVVNQPTWNLGTYAATHKAALDINTWLV